MLDRLTIERMATEAGEGPILIALSGGGDSVAVLHLLAAEFGVTNLRAAIVDHALRDGSARDAQRAFGFAQSLGVDGEILTLTWPNGPRRAQEDARDARYAALCDYARAIGARAIAVAHNADDQAETIMMRMAAKSGERGLAGISAFAPAPLWPEGRGIWIARPLLNVRRAALRDYLRARSADWIEDPANTNTAFERVRVRQTLAAREEAGEAYLEPLLMMAAEQRVRADKLDAEAAALVDVAARFTGDMITLDPAHWRGASEVRQRALSALIAAAAGAQREPPRRAVARLLGQLDDPEFAGATLGGAALSRHRGAIRISRDPGAVEGRAGVAPLAWLKLTKGVATVWDGRLEVTAPQPDWWVARDGVRPKLCKSTEALQIDDAPWASWLLEAHAAHALGRIAVER